MHNANTTYLDVSSERMFPGKTGNTDAAQQSAALFFYMMFFIAVTMMGIPAGIFGYYVRLLPDDVDRASYAAERVRRYPASDNRSDSQLHTEEL
jgi:hypothetical protein